MVDVATATTLRRSGDGPCGVENESRIVEVAVWL